MKRGKVFQISKDDYQKALKEGVTSIIGAHEGEIISADVEQAQDGTYWLQFISEVKNGK